MERVQSYCKSLFSFSSLDAADGEVLCRPLLVRPLPTALVSEPKILVTHCEQNATRNLVCPRAGSIEADIIARGVVICQEKSLDSSSRNSGMSELCSYRSKGLLSPQQIDSTQYHLRNVSDRNIYKRCD